MQTLFMPTLLSSMFPAIGAIVLGSVNSLLYCAVPSLVPLIIAHTVFFLVAVY
jgi:hypothetical protein